MESDEGKSDYRDREYPNYKARFEIDYEDYGNLSPDDPRKKEIDDLLKEKKKIDDRTG